MRDMDTTRETESPAPDVLDKLSEQFYLLWSEINALEDQIHEAVAALDAVAKAVARTRRAADRAVTTDREPHA